MPAVRAERTRTVLTGAAAAGAALAVAAGAAGLRRLARRSGVTDADLAAPLPGEELVLRPSFTVDRVAVLLDPPHALVHHSLRQRSNGWRWPEPDMPRPPDCFEFSWALALRPVPGDRSRLHIRLRAAATQGRMSPLLELGGGLVDYLTVELLFRGLEERFAPS